MIEQVLRLINLKKENWLPIHDRVPSINTLPSINKFNANNVPGYLNEIFSNAEYNGIPTRCSHQ